MTTRAAPQRYVALDGLRGVAALGVALFHYDGSIMPGGYLAVDFFFALSGFVLARTYGSRLASTMGTAQFMRVRLVRLYPLFACGIVFGALFAVQGTLRGVEGSLSWPVFLATLPLNLAMLPSPFDPMLFPLNIPSWSLFYELLANLALAAGLIRLPTRALVLIAVFGAAGLLVWGTGYDNLGGGDAWDATVIALLRTTFSFTAGVLMARLAQPEARPAGLIALGCMAVLALALHYDLAGSRVVYDAFVIIVLSPLLLFIGSRREPSAFAAPAAAFLGEVSFALYAIHVPVSHAFQKLSRLVGVPMWQLALPYLAVALVLAWLAVRLIDTPARRYLARLRT